MNIAEKPTPAEFCLHLFLSAAAPLQGMFDRPGRTHGFCNSQALTILRSDGFTLHADFLQLFRRELNLGVYWADKGWKNIHHYYEPTAGKGLWHFDNALHRFEVYYHASLAALRRADLGRAAFAVGAAAHLVQDLCVPHHARAKMLDGHKQYETWAELYHNKYAVNNRGVYNEGRSAGSLLVANAVTAAAFFDWVKREDDEAYYHLTTQQLLPLAQRTTAGLLWRFANEAAKIGIDIENAVVKCRAAA